MSRMQNVLLWVVALVVIGACGMTGIFLYQQYYPTIASNVNSIASDVSGDATVLAQTLASEADKTGIASIFATVQARRATQTAVSRQTITPSS